ncbi:hypothetical protein HD806DRAFT_539710 [Xylariaceae sp. AK1471]|nr:hypothetical protein HD806DRAFT_539710 [Xylariaceae sp. AK1471]
MAMADFTYHGQAGTYSTLPRRRGHISPKGLALSIFDGFPNLNYSTDIFATSFSEANRQGSLQKTSTSNFRDLLKLNRKLGDDYDDLKKAHSNPHDLILFPIMETAIGSALSRTSRLSDMMAKWPYLMQLAVESAMLEDLANSQRARPQLNLDANNQSHGALLMTILATAYIFLTPRLAPTLFHLYQLIITTSSGEIVHLTPVLQTLQLGKFHVRAGTCVQIGALLDLIADKLQIFEICLGIDSEDGSDASNVDLAISRDSNYISIRETLLAQERLRRPSENSASELPPKEVINTI